MKKYLPLFILSPLVVILDQVTKSLIVQHIAFGQKIVVLQNYFEIVHVRNEGAAFGMLSQWDSGARMWFFYGVSLLAMLALFLIYAKSKASERRVHIPLALILGGALGNLIDRWRYGNVVDFLRFHWQEKVTNFEIFGKPIRIYLSWPSFNVADIAITCGALSLIVVLLFFDSKKTNNNLSTFD